ncbi:MAG TPA: hypothetical protein VK358_12865 [Longimicrobium sp.]|nr:hypothetical protein [Longimicrobium sp.]
MPRYFYGTVPVLTWIINHYFYAGVHYSWLAAEFAPMLRNPKSSNPYLIYGDLYWAWAKRDRYDRYVGDTGRVLGGVVDRKREEGTLDHVTAARLRRVCRSRNSVDLYYPIIYRVDVQQIAERRQRVENSGLEGSAEVLVPDLRESEFDLLFADNTSDALFAELVLDEIAAPGRRDPLEVLSMLEERIR